MRPTHPAGAQGLAAGRGGGQTHGQYAPDWPTHGLLTRLDPARARAPGVQPNGWLARSSLEPRGRGTRPSRGEGGRRTCSTHPPGRPTDSRPHGTRPGPPRAGARGPARGSTKRIGLDRSRLRPTGRGTRPSRAGAAARGAGGETENPSSASSFRGVANLTVSGGCPNFTRKAPCPNLAKYPRRQPYTLPYATFQKRINTAPVFFKNYHRVGYRVAGGGT